MSDDKSPIEQALDVLLYAPLGLVFSARELLPSLAEKGRSQLGMAKMVGQFAAKQGQQEAEKRLGAVREQALTTLEGLAGFNGNGAGDGASQQPAPTAAASEDAERTAATPTVAVAPAAPTSGPEAAALAIPDYDSLSASQVLPRLQGLSTDELEAVRDYESGHRGRKTILNRVAQLQG